MSVTVLLMSNGRRPYLKATWASAVQSLLVAEEITRIVIHEDSADPRMFRWVADNLTGPARRSTPIRMSVIGGKRLGFGGAIAASWDYLVDHDDNPFVFHLEDDFTFNRQVPMSDLLHILEHHPYIVQMALRRQAWSEHEKLAGGVIEQHPDAYAERQDARGNVWLEHRLFWTTNPSLYRRSLCAVGWPAAPQSEGVFTHQLIQNDPDLRFAYAGRRDDEPWVHHIGDDRMSGHGY